MLDQLQIHEFDQVYQILEDSFPEDERGTYKQEKSFLEEEAYTIHVYKEEDQVLGFISSWEMHDFTYVDHFAIHEEARGMGLGSKIIKEVDRTNDKPICLEVEYPETEIAARRINFYKRNGLFLNDYNYVQPPLSPGKNPCDFLIMTSQRKLTGEEFASMSKSIYKNVFGKELEGGPDDLFS